MQLAAEREGLGKRGSVFFFTPFVSIPFSFYPSVLLLFFPHSFPSLLSFPPIPSLLRVLLLRPFHSHWMLLLLLLVNSCRSASDSHSGNNIHSFWLILMVMPLLYNNGLHITSVCWPAHQLRFGDVRFVGFRKYNSVLHFDGAVSISADVFHSWTPYSTNTSPALRPANTLLIRHDTVCIDCLLGCYYSFSPLVSAQLISASPALWL